MDDILEEESFTITGLAEFLELIETLSSEKAQGEMFAEAAGRGANLELFLAMTETYTYLGRLKKEIVTLRCVDDIRQTFISEGRVVPEYIHHGRMKLGASVYTQSKYVLAQLTAMDKKSDDEKWGTALKSTPTPTKESTSVATEQ
jgi:hypothetical protein